MPLIHDNSPPSHAVIGSSEQAPPQTLKDKFCDWAPSVAIAGILLTAAFPALRYAAQIVPNAWRESISHPHMPSLDVRQFKERIAADTTHPGFGFINSAPETKYHLGFTEVPLRTEEVHNPERLHLKADIISCERTETGYIYTLGCDSKEFFKVETESELPSPPELPYGLGSGSAVRQVANFVFDQRFSPGSSTVKFHIPGQRESLRMCLMNCGIEHEMPCTHDARVDDEVRAVVGRAK